MVDSLGQSTRMSLLLRLRDCPEDQAAWGAFVDRYGPRIFSWCRHWGLQEADAQDVTQMVLVKLVRTIPDFIYDPGRSFRGWLRTLTHNAWSDFLGEQRRAVPALASGGDGEAHPLDTAQAREDLVQRITEAFDQELLERVMEDVQARVEPKTWEAFRRTALEGQSAADVASALEMRVGTVYQARSNVQRLLRETLTQMRGNDADAEADGDDAS